VNADQTTSAACGEPACTGHTVDRIDEARATALVLDALGRSVATVEAPAEAIRRAVAISTTRGRVNPLPPHRVGLWRVRVTPYPYKDRWSEAPFGDRWRRIKAGARRPSEAPR
jgi:hypothetical protein